jgi:uncharacterized protein YbjQ (UPF0145 family)
MDSLIALLLSVVAILAGLFVGKATEKKHLASLAQREAESADLLVLSLKQPLGLSAEPHTPALVCGEAVIASDAFKSWATGLRNIFGGEAKNFGLLYQRARREATLRMLEDARRQGFNAVCNVRHMSTDIGGNAVRPANKGMPMATCLAFGTGYKRG